MLKKQPHNGQMLYKVIYMRYIDEEELPVEEICKRLNISKPTYALYRKEAISFISTRLWGTDDSTFTTVCAIFDLLSNINS